MVYKLLDKYKGRTVVGCDHVGVHAIFYPMRPTEPDLHLYGFAMLPLRGIVGLMDTAVVLWCVPCYESLYGTRLAQAVSQTEA